jgi:CMP-N-acetylneuraminic acid synthetase
MYKGKSILGIIIARGGSKRLPNKNIRNLAGKPLIAWTIESGMKSKYMDRVILSSEDSEIIRIAKEHGCEVPFIRPSYLSRDESSSADVVTHAVNSLDVLYDYTILLQPTTPLRTCQEVDECVEKCINENAKSVVSVSKADKSPYLYYAITDDKLIPFKRKKENDHSDYYILNGAIYMFNTKYFLKVRSFTNKSSICYVMPREHSIDIDTILDFKLAEYLAGKSQRS